MNTNREPAASIRMTGPTELLTAIPYLLRYNPPEGSLVLIAIQARQVVLTARLDLPDAGEIPAAGALADQVWTHIVRHLHKSDADALVVVAYAGPEWTPELDQLVATSPLPLLDLIRVRDGRWWSLTCPDPDGCGHPACSPDGAERAPDPQVETAFIATGAAAPGTREQLAACLAPGPDELRASVADQLARLPHRDRERLYQAVAEAHEARTGGPDPIPPLQAAVLLQALADPTVRDQAMAWVDDAGWWLWHDLIPTAPAGHIAPVATLIAVTAYQRGDTVMADIATRHALGDDPGYRLALLIRDSLRAAIHPDAIRALVGDALAEYALLALRQGAVDPTTDGDR